MKGHLVLLLTLILSSCGDKVTQVHNHYNSLGESSQSNQLSGSDDLKALEKLLSEKRPNLALAQLIADAIGKGSEKDISKFLEGISTIEVQELVENIRQENLSVRRRYLYHGKSYENNGSFLMKTLGAQQELSDSSF